MNFATNHMSLEEDPEPGLNLQPCSSPEMLNREPLVRSAWTPDPQNYDIINVCCFKP